VALVGIEEEAIVSETANALPVAILEVPNVPL
jgi:hypothetical protein